MAQWLRLCAPNAGGWVRSLARELDPTSHKEEFTGQFTAKIKDPNAAAKTQHSQVNCLKYIFKKNQSLEKLKDTWGDKIKDMRRHFSLGKHSYSKDKTQPTPRGINMTSHSKGLFTSVPPIQYTTFSFQQKLQWKFKHKNTAFRDKASIRTRLRNGKGFEIFIPGFKNS